MIFFFSSSLNFLRLAFGKLMHKVESPFYILASCCSVYSVSHQTEIEQSKYNTRGDNQMKADSSAGKKVVFNGDFGDFSLMSLSMLNLTG